ncbi:MAG: hypothetical protein HN561_13125 [Candidatus Scalindua sp.]|jgi:hypothetical protein|nr:hypothetical protein [Candidatus Scalindua sp.]MBT7591995.1 hypothetical protein [Candidatus Scalindua sp.]
MKSQSLPYDMGNAGDLLKHGILAEYTQWWCRNNAKPMRFLDPFGGRPWVESPKYEVTLRVEKLSEFALFHAQPEPKNKYYGSSHIVNNMAKALGQDAQIFVSDRDSDALKDLCNSGLEKLCCPGFDPNNGVSILDTNIEADLLLLDPFEDFLISQDLKDSFQRIKSFSERMAVVVFILNKDQKNKIGRQYTKLKREYLSQAWALHCPKLKNQKVRGESGYIIEVLLLLPAFLRPSAKELRNTLIQYSQCLTKVLGASVQFLEGRSF